MLPQLYLHLRLPQLLQLWLARLPLRADEVRAMWIPILLTLALVLGFGLAWNFGRRGGKDT